MVFDERHSIESVPIVSVAVAHVPRIDQRFAKMYVYLYVQLNYFLNNNKKKIFQLFKFSFSVRCNQSVKKVKMTIYNV